VIVIGTTSAHDDRMSEDGTSAIETGTETEVEATATVGVEVARRHDVQGETKKILMMTDVVSRDEMNDDLKRLHDVLPLPLEDVTVPHHVHMLLTRWI